MLRILLIGEYSGVHTDIATALRKKGHYVVTAHSGDGFKNYKRDIDLDIKGKTKVIRLYRGYLRYFRFYRRIKKERFDIIQFINPGLFPPYINNFLFSLIFNIKAKFVLLACGGDTLVWKHFKERLYRYFPYDGVPEEQFRKEQLFYESPSLIKLSNRVYKRVDTIVALLVEYYIAHREHSHKMHFIPLSIDCDCISEKADNKVEGKIVIYHPISKGREGEKGSDIILEVLKRIEEEYANTVEIIFSRSIPFDEYKKMLKKANIVLDQTYSYSPSMNALYSMSIGKVVLGGAEKEYLEQLNIASTPMINIIPDAEDIYDKLVRLIRNPEQIEKIGKDSFDFVRQYHSVDSNVNKFQQIWNGLMNNTQ